MNMPDDVGREEEVPDLKGHAVGILDRPEDCERLTNTLIARDFPPEHILTLHGETGIEQLDALMGASGWGESAEAFLDIGTKALQSGQCVMCVEVEDVQDAQTVAALAIPYGGHHFYHFGTLVDTRLTA